MPTGVGARALATLILGLSGAVLLALAELSTVVEIQVGDVVVHSESGGERHNWALLVLALGAVPLSVLAALSRIRTTAMVSAACLAMVAIASLLFWGVGDLPDTTRTGEFGVRYEAARASAGLGVWLELLGALALLGTAAGAALAARRR